MKRYPWFGLRGRTICVAALGVGACGDDAPAESLSVGDGTTMQTSVVGTSTGEPTTTGLPTTSGTSGGGATDGTGGTSTGEPTTGGESSSTGAPPAACGDGVVDEGEECDVGAGNADTAACTSACKNAACGDGLVQAGVEACDDGNDVDDDDCTNACALASCGDGVVQPGEECDDGNDVFTDACLSTCLNASCGDGALQIGVEVCDDGNDGQGVRISPCCSCDALPGFILRVLPTGKRVFIARYRDAAGKDHRHRLGLMGPGFGADEARREAMAILAHRVADASAVADMYLKPATANKYRSMQQLERICRYILRPPFALGRRPGAPRWPSAPAPRPHSFTTTRSHLRIFDAAGTQLAAEIPWLKVPDRDRSCCSPDRAPLRRRVHPPAPRCRHARVSPRPQDRAKIPRPRAPRRSPGRLYVPRVT